MMKLSSLAMILCLMFLFMLWMLFAEQPNEPLYHLHVSGNTDGTTLYIRCFGLKKDGSEFDEGHETTAELGTTLAFWDVAKITCWVKNGNGDKTTWIALYKEDTAIDWNSLYFPGAEGSVSSTKR